MVKKLGKKHVAKASCLLVWQTSGVCMADKWDVYGRQVGCVWQTNETCMVDKRDVYAGQAGRLSYGDEKEKLKQMFFSCFHFYVVVLYINSRGV